MAQALHNFNMFKSLLKLQVYNLGLSILCQDKD